MNVPALGELYRFMKNKTIKKRKGIDMKTRIYDSQYGEVKLRETYDCDTDTYGIDCYIGDNYDEFVGEIHCGIDDDEEIENQLSEIL